MTTATREESPRGRSVWRTMDEWAETDEFRDLVSREFPSVLPEFFDEATRRQFLRVMGASILLAGATGCAYQPPESIVPYVVQPAKITPGKPLMYATAIPSCGYAMGAIVETHEGRPTHVSGNPAHPASLGACDPFMTASILDLYDPDRSQAVLRNGRASTWGDFLAAWTARREVLEETKGEGFRILTGAVTSPTLSRMISELLKAYPKARWHAHEPTEGDGAAGIALAVSEGNEARYFIDKADVIVSLDADFLAWGPGRLAYARQFASRREIHPDDPQPMNRLYAAEPAPTITGAMADHRLSARAGRIAALARAIAEGVAERKSSAKLDDAEAAWVSRVVADLKAHRGRSLVLAGAPQPREVHALAIAINGALGNYGETIKVIEFPAIDPRRGIEETSLTTLAGDMAAGRVSTLLILGSNPVYDAPGDLRFASALSKLDTGSAMTIHLGQHEGETAKLSHWHLPEAHPLETWGDLRAFDGTVTIAQPMIRPLYGGRSAIEVIAALLGRDETSGLGLVRVTWAKYFVEGTSSWREAVHSGVVRGTEMRAVGGAPKPLAQMLDELPPPEPDHQGVKRGGSRHASGLLGEESAPGYLAEDGLELCFRPDPTIWDGRHANNGWLQELPKPITKLTWDNAARIAPKTAERLGIRSEQIVELRYRGRTLRVAAWIDPGHHEGSVTLSLGYGRTSAGRVGSGQGFNAYALRTSDAPWGGSGLEVVPTSATYKLANTQHHQVMEGRELVRAATLADFVKDPKFAQDHHDPAKLGLTLYEEVKYDGHKWGMSINLNTCIGCNACVTACQSENNCPVVGKDQVVAGRDLHWIRIDRYYEGEPEEPTAIYHQPVPCMHCENAPCEVVCPVNATVHDAEGLNVMVYNRCVGTRYCSNNCPYKVRRFNFLAYSEHPPESLKLMHNPEVTVRTRGVMEKCSYCVQRIVNGRTVADQEGRPLRDGEVVTACQSACPTRAIVFGDLNDKTAAVVKAKADPRDYSLLGDLNTRPRTTYLAKITNPGEGDPR